MTENPVTSLHHGARFEGHHAVRAMIAGVLTGWIELTVGYPIEYLKTTIQLDRQKTSALQSLQWIVQRYGFGGLYRGVVPILVGSVPKSAIRFGTFEYAKTQLETWPPPYAHFLACGLLAGLIEGVLVVTPMETVKVRFIRDRTLPQPRYHGYLQGIADIIRQDGLRGIYKGLAPTVLKQSLCQTIRFGILEYGKDSYQHQHPEPIPMRVIGAYGLLAGFVSALISSPVDVVKTRLQGRPQCGSMLRCCRAIWRTEGLHGFFKGNLLRLTRVCCEVAMVFMIYENISQQLDRL